MHDGTNLKCIRGKNIGDKCKIILRADHYGVFNHVADVPRQEIQHRILSEKLPDFVGFRRIWA